MKPLKVTRRRQVYQAHLPGLPPVVIKHYPPRCGFPEALRDFWRTRGEVEFECGRQLREAGIPCPAPLAWAEGIGPDHGRESWLVSEAILGAQALGPYLEARFRPGDQDPRKLRLVGRALALARHMHGAGFLHRDFHGGNLLLREAEGPGGVLYLIDCPRTWSLGVVPPAWQAREVAHLFHTLRHVLDRGEARTLLQETARDGLTVDLLERARGRYERRSDRSRSRRALVPCTQFAHENPVDLHVIRDRSLPMDGVRALVAAHDQAIQEGASTVLRFGTRSRLSRQEHPDLGAVIVKEYPSSARHASTRARRAWVGGVAMRARDIPTPAPLALVTRIRGSSYLLMAAADPAVPLHFLASRARPPDQDRLMDRLGRLLICLFSRQLFHSDLSPKNLLWDPQDPESAVQLVDWDAVRPRTDWTPRRRVRALVQLSDLPGPALADASWRSLLSTVLSAIGEAHRADWYEQQWLQGLRQRQWKHAERRS